MPHRHPEHRICTVISGVFYIGIGGEFDADKPQANPPGAVTFCLRIQRIFTGQNPASTTRI
jgi:hypothetical protein